MPGFSVSLSGLDASSQALSIIANNLANINTTGFKSSAVNFTTLFYQNLGSSNSGQAIQGGTGATVGSITTNYADGAVNTTGIDSNAALQGAGMFVIDPTDQQLYTRDGDFVVGSNGLLQTASGASVLGFPAVNGTVDTNAPIGALQVGAGVTSAASATQNVELNLNLSAAAATGSTFSAPVQVFDSMGGSHTLTATFTNQSPNSWTYSVTMPGMDTNSTTDTTLASGTLNFNSSGVLIPTTVTTPQTETVSLQSGALADGANPLSINWNLYDGQGNALITQNASASAAQSTQQDGYAAGNMLNFTIESDGTITGSFSNGQTAALGQLAIANFANPQALTAEGNNAFAASADSGLPTIGIAGTGGLGTVTGGADENSNVDIATEFADLIQAQQGYEANAHTLTTFDQIVQQTLNMQSAG